MALGKEATGAAPKKKSFPSLWLKYFSILKNATQPHNLFHVTEKVNDGTNIAIQWAWFQGSIFAIPCLV